jgi:hypothetical protein
VIISIFLVVLRWARRLRSMNYRMRTIFKELRILFFCMVAAFFFDGLKWSS